MPPLAHACGRPCSDPGDCLHAPLSFIIRYSARSQYWFWRPSEGGRSSHCFRLQQLSKYHAATESLDHAHYCQLMNKLTVRDVIGYFPLRTPPRDVHFLWPDPSITSKMLTRPDPTRPNLTSSGSGNGNGKCEFIQRSCYEVSNALSTLVAREKPGFQALSKGFIVPLCAEVVRQGVPDHGALHGIMLGGQQWIADVVAPTSSGWHQRLNFQNAVLSVLFNVEWKRQQCAAECTCLTCLRLERYRKQQHQILSVVISKVSLFETEIISVSANKTQTDVLIATVLRCSRSNLIIYVLFV